MNEEAQAVAKRKFIEAFFQDLRGRIWLVDRLYAEGHEDEARLLVTCYIEALGNGLAGDTAGGAENFVRALIKHGGEPSFGLVLPYALLYSLPLKGVSEDAKRNISGVLEKLPSGEALTLEQLADCEITSYPPDAAAFLRREAWRATVANATYRSIRSLGVHWFGSPSKLTFSNTTFKGSQVPPVDFDMLRRALGRICDFAQSLSVDTGKWFGQD